MHRIFFPRINYVLEQFTLVWNKDLLRTAQNWLIKEIDLSCKEDLEWYGYDPDAPIPIENLSHVKVEDVKCPLNNDQLALLNTVDVLGNSGSYGIDICIRGLTVVELR